MFKKTFLHYMDADKLDPFSTFPEHYFKYRRGFSQSSNTLLDDFFGNQEPCLPSAARGAVILESIKKTRGEIFPRRFFTFTFPFHVLTNMRTPFDVFLVLGDGKVASRYENVFFSKNELGKSIKLLVKRVYPYALAGTIKNMARDRDFWRFFNSVVKGLSNIPKPKTLELKVHPYKLVAGLERIEPCALCYVPFVYLSLLRDYRAWAEFAEILFKKAVNIALDFWKTLTEEIVQRYGLENEDCVSWESRVKIFQRFEKEEEKWYYEYAREFLNTIVSLVKLDYALRFCIPFIHSILTSFTLLALSELGKDYSTSHEEIEELFLNICGIFLFAYDAFTSEEENESGDNEAEVKYRKTLEVLKDFLRSRYNVDEKSAKRFISRFSGQFFYLLKAIFVMNCIAYSAFIDMDEGNWIYFCGDDGKGGFSYHCPEENDPLKGLLDTLNSVSEKRIPDVFKDFLNFSQVFRASALVPHVREKFMKVIEKNEQVPGRTETPEGTEETTRKVFANSAGVKGKTLDIDEPDYFLPPAYLDYYEEVIENRNLHPKIKHVQSFLKENFAYLKGLIYTFPILKEYVGELFSEEAIGETKLYSTDHRESEDFLSLVPGAEEKDFESYSAGLLSELVISAAAYCSISGILETLEKLSKPYILVDAPRELQEAVYTPLLRAAHSIVQLVDVFRTVAFEGGVIDTSGELTQAYLKAKKEFEDIFESIKNRSCLSIKFKESTAVCQKNGKDVEVPLCSALVEKFLETLTLYPLHNHGFLSTHLARENMWRDVVCSLSGVVGGNSEDGLLDALELVGWKERNTKKSVFVRNYYALPERFSWNDVKNVKEKGLFLETVQILFPEDEDFDIDDESYTRNRLEGDLFFKHAGGDDWEKLIFPFELLAFVSGHRDFMNYVDENKLLHFLDGEVMVEFIKRYYC